MKKLIFLDIDGVLNSYSQPGSIQPKKPTKGYRIKLDPDCLDRFVNLVRQVEAERHDVSIVLSSSARQVPELVHELNIHFSRVGLKPVVGVTPNFAGKRRGDEILAYLKEYPCPRPDWIALEDEWPGMEPVIDRMVYPYLYEGLQDGDVRLAVQLLLGN